jgi:HTH-type transcriptional regulator/antitoxin HigA
MKVRVIKTEQDYESALTRIEQLMERKPSAIVTDELELLATLVELYEEKTFPMGHVHPVDAIRFRMEQQELKQKDLIAYMGSKSKVSEVLAGKRPLSLSMIRKLHEGLEIPLDILLGEETETLQKIAEPRATYRTKKDVR